MKRALDLCLSAVGLVLLSPVMVVIAYLVRRDSPGPAIFKQERIGRFEQPFALFKFRSMADSANPFGPLVTTAHDPRVTRVGRTLRATKLDELPQLFNVLRGDMSLVGPRPEVADYVALWNEADRRVVLSVRPGVTDPASIGLRRESELLDAQDDAESYYREVLLPRKVQMYREYVETRTLPGDLAIIGRTLVSVIRE